MKRVRPVRLVLRRGETLCPACQGVNGCKIAPGRAAPSTELRKILPTPAKEPDFEQALAELENLVERLERGDLPLDEALKTFERGVALTRHCQTSLKAAQQKVEILLKKNGQSELQPFAGTDDAPADDE